MHALVVPGFCADTITLDVSPFDVQAAAIDRAIKQASRAAITHAPRVAVKAFNPEMLRLAREARELTQAELAQKSGITQAFISKLEKGLNTQPGKRRLSVFLKPCLFPKHFSFSRKSCLGYHIFISGNEPSLEPNLSLELEQ